MEQSLVSEMNLINLVERFFFSSADQLINESINHGSSSVLARHGLVLLFFPAFPLRRASRGKYWLAQFGTRQETPLQQRSGSALHPLRRGETFLPLGHWVPAVL